MLAFAFAAIAPATGQAAATQGRLPCVMGNAAVNPGRKAVDRAVQLAAEPSSQSKVRNLGADRDPESVIFTITATPALPDGVENRINLVADTIVRTGQESAETVTFPDPLFSRLEVSPNRQRIRFRVCLNPPNDLPAGSYTGVVDIEGPVGLEATAVTVTLNARNGLLFLIGAFLTLVLAFATLTYKSASDRRTKTIEKATTDAEKRNAQAWKPAFEHTFRDVGWWFATVAALATSFGALFALYRDNPAWGGEDWGAVAALIGTGLAAVGAKAIFTPSGSS